MKRWVITTILRPMYIEMIMPYVDTPFVKVLSGVHRCGKSTILKMIAEELRRRGVQDKRMPAYHFDSLQHEDIKTAELLYEDVKQQLSKDGKTYLFLDEIHRIHGYGEAQSDMQDRLVGAHCQVYF